MKKKVFIGLLFLMCAAFLFAEGGKANRYRYGFLEEGVGIKIIDLPNPMPAESIDNVYVIPMNTVEEQFIATYGYDSLSNYFYSGALSLMYIDLTNPDDPKMEPIYSWSDFLAYISWEE